MSSALHDGKTLSSEISKERSAPPTEETGTSGNSRKHQTPKTISQSEDSNKTFSVDGDGSSWEKKRTEFESRNVLERNRKSRKGKEGRKEEVGSIGKKSAGSKGDAGTITEGKSDKKGNKDLKPIPLRREEHGVKQKTKKYLTDRQSYQSREVNQTQDPEIQPSTQRNIKSSASTSSSTQVTSSARSSSSSFASVSSTSSSSSSSATDVNTAGRKAIKSQTIDGSTAESRSSVTCDKQLPVLKSRSEKTKTSKNNTSTLERRFNSQNPVPESTKKNPNLKSDSTSIHEAIDLKTIILDQEGILSKSENSPTVKTTKDMSTSDKVKQPLAQLTNRRSFNDHGRGTNDAIMARKFSSIDISSPRERPLSPSRIINPPPQKVLPKLRPNRYSLPSIATSSRYSALTPSFSSSGLLSLFGTKNSGKAELDVNDLSLTFADEEMRGKSHNRYEKRRGKEDSKNTDNIKEKSETDKERSGNPGEENILYEDEESAKGERNDYGKHEDARRIKSTSGSDTEFKGAEEWKDDSKLWMEGRNLLREEEDSAAWVSVGDVEMLRRTKCRRLYAKVGQSKDLALFYKGGNFYALEAWCSHMGGPLFQGDIEDYRGRCHVMCPWHAYMFDLTNGQSDIGLQQQVFPVRVEHCNLQIKYICELSIYPFL